MRAELAYGDLYPDNVVPPGFRVSESNLAGIVLELLSDAFHVEREVRGRHWTGKSVRVDAVLRPKDSSNWTEADPAILLEFKNFFTSHNAVSQCIQYTCSEFQGVDGPRQVYLYPGFRSVMAQAGNRDNYAATCRIYGKANVGELNVETYPAGVSPVFRMNGHAVWISPVPDVEPRNRGTYYGGNRKRTRVPSGSLALPDTAGRLTRRRGLSWRETRTATDQVKGQLWKQ